VSLQNSQKIFLGGAGAPYAGGPSLCLGTFGTMVNPALMPLMQKHIHVYWAVKRIYLFWWLDHSCMGGYLWHLRGLSGLACISSPPPMTRQALWAYNAVHRTTLNLEGQMIRISWRLWGRIKVDVMLRWVRPGGGIGAKLLFTTALKYLTKKPALNLQNVNKTWYTMLYSMSSFTR